MQHIELPRFGDMISAVPDVTYEEVRQSFFVLLDGEHTRLRALSAALRSGTPAAVGVLDDLETYAHRLRGAAAVFNFPELRDAAKALEIAANEAVVEEAPASDSRVAAAIRSLGARLCARVHLQKPEDNGELPANTRQTLVEH